MKTILKDEDFPEHINWTEEYRNKDDIIQYFVGHSYIYKRDLKETIDRWVKIDGEIYVLNNNFKPTIKRKSI